MDDPKQTVDTGLERLREVLRGMQSVLVAFSGGTDSSLLAAVAHEVLGRRMLAVTGVSPSLPRHERETAARMAAEYGWPHRFVETRELDCAAYAANPPDRCFYCKSELFARLRALADGVGLRWLADGTNLDDARDYRPGERAKKRWQVRSPLQEAGFDKPAVRAAARRLGLETADTPASACLASRLPYGTAITVERLALIERAEAALAGLGFRQLRVRLHDDVARIELHPDEIGRAVPAAMRRRIAEALHAGGCRYVALDLDGYRMGSLNAVLDKKEDRT